MIPRIKTGNSFKGAGLYYLNDKRLPGEQVRTTSERVAWTFALNTLEDEPDAVLAEMRQTAFDQSLLKLQSGNRSDGRPTQKAVMTVALAWSPVQSPDKAHMIETGRSFLKHMGFEGHQALFVCHDDTKHPHFHIILNRVHPETGMTLDDAWSKKRAQQWALSYERSHGRIFCEVREAKYGRGEPVNARHKHHGEWRAALDHSNDNALDADRQRQADEWTNLKDSQREERQAFWKETAAARRELRASVRQEVRDEFAPQWQAYALHKAQKQEAARRFDQETRRALRHYRRLHGTEAVRQLKERQKAYHKQQRDELTRERVAINAQIKERAEASVALALDKLGEQRRPQYEELLARQRNDRADLRDSQLRPSAIQHSREDGQAHAEQTDARRGRTDKQIDQDARRQARLERYLAERKADRERDRGDGGRER